MCVTFIFIRPENDLTSKYKLIILNNRDEVLARKTSTLAWENGILCGRDEQAQDRGTWFGVTKQGKVGVLLSITQPVHEKNHDAPSRGAIVPKYLQSDLCAADFVDNLAEIVEPFNGFQFLAFDRTENGNFELTTLVHKFVDEVKPRKWPVDGGVFVFGNSPPEKPYKKVVRGTELFKAAMTKIAQAPESEVSSTKPANKANPFDM
uniref:Transport and Golgi organization protein 2 n=1 Tax=Panagrolaimus sp. JU765 TaxID=591449 RepID=A0AC34R8G5_9BILA